jgi:myo-inositol-1(or 4)-monophosphatase
MEAFWEESLEPWDTRAGALIVEQAGGVVTGMDGAPWHPANRHILASNGHIHEELLSIIREAR